MKVVRGEAGQANLQGGAPYDACQLREPLTPGACRLGVKSALLAYITIGALSHEY